MFFNVQENEEDVLGGKLYIRQDSFICKRQETFHFQTFKQKNSTLIYYVAQDS